MLQAHVPHHTPPSILIPLHLHDDLHQGLVVRAHQRIVQFGVRSTKSVDEDGAQRRVSIGIGECIVDLLDGGDCLDVHRKRARRAILSALVVDEAGKATKRVFAHLRDLVVAGKDVELDERHTSGPLIAADWVLVEGAKHLVFVLVVQPCGEDCEGLDVDVGDLDDGVRCFLSLHTSAR
jgi:hypothetical protein